MYELINKFELFCKVDLQLADLTVRTHRQHILQFIKALNKPLSEVTIEDIRNYLIRFKDKAPKTYRNQLCTLKVFFRDFLCKPELIKSFRFPSVPIKIKNNLPDKNKLKQFYEALPSLREKAIFLMLASTGLRISECLNLTFKDIDFEKRMIMPNSHLGRTKLSWITFYNHECEQALSEYLKIKNKSSNRLFPISRNRVAHIFKETSNKTSVYVTPQLLREWFACEMARLGVPDRYVDAFCGRVPRSILARHYTDYSPERLKEIYDKANLRVLS